MTMYNFFICFFLFDCSRFFFVCDELEEARRRGRKNKERKINQKRQTISAYRFGGTDSEMLYGFEANGSSKVTFDTVDYTDTQIKY